MMQVQEVSKEGLKHEFSFTIPSADMEQMLTERLTKIAKTANIQGFRPGKAPLTIIKQRYGANARAEAMDDAVTNSIHTALTERKLRPAMNPKIDLVSADEGKDLEFKVTLEVLPEVTLSDFTKISLERPVVEVAEDKIIETITRVAKQVREPEAITEARASKMGDVVIIDFDGTIDGERQPGMKAEGHKLELGSKSFIDTFEEQLVGLKVEDKKDVKVTFPADYQATNLAGKEAVFAVTLHEIRQQKEVVLDDELAKELGFTTIADLKKRVGDDIGQDYARGARTVLKKGLLDQLATTHKFDVPPTLLETEFNGIWQQVQQAKTKGELPEEDKAKSEDDLRKEYHDIAERRIRLGLVLAEVGQQQDIKVTSNEIRDAMMAEARRFPGQEQAVVNYYTKTEGAIDRLRAPILEEKTVDYILSQAQITEKKVTIEELLKMQEEDDEA